MIIIIIAIAILLCFLLTKYKIPKVGNMILITGGIKTGKTMLSVRLAKKLYNQQLIKYYIRYAFQYLKPKNKRKVLEKPLLYSNIPLKLKYVPLTTDLLCRRERFAYGSVCYVCESSLVADSMSYKDDEMNERLLLFNKLFAHETRGSYLVYDTQSICDNHFSIRRCLSTYLHIHHTTKIPFFPFVVMHLREMYYSDDGNISNTQESDVEDNLKITLVPKSTWKLYDRYCYSVLTDNLPCDNKVINNEKNKDLKARKIISFKKFKTIEKEIINNE